MDSHLQVVGTFKVGKESFNCNVTQEEMKSEAHAIHSILTTLASARDTGVKELIRINLSLYADFAAPAWLIKADGKYQFGIEEGV
jgi:hypothetical protein